MSNVSPELTARLWLPVELREGLAVVDSRGWLPEWMRAVSGSSAGSTFGSWWQGALTAAASLPDSVSCSAFFPPPSADARVGGHENAVSRFSSPCVSLTFRRERHLS